MKNLGYIVGMLLLIVGLTSLMLSVTGVNYSFLSFMKGMDGTLSLLLRLGMTIGGIIILLIASTNWQKERADALDAPRWDETPPDR